jgi:RNA methyltransferase, TrmH family
VIAAVDLHRRRGRIRSLRSLLEGPIVVGEAVTAGADVETVFALESDDVGRSLATAAAARLVIATEAVLARVSTTRAPQSPVAVIRIPPPAGHVAGRVLVPWGVGDPGNCGTLIRSAAAFGYGYATGPGSAETWAPKVIRSAAGGHFRTTIGVYSAVSEIRESGLRLFAAVPDGGVPPGPLPEDAAVVIGSESHGLPGDVVAEADGLITIPMVGGVESLNAAVSGSIIAFAGLGADEPRRSATENVLPSQHS